MKGKRQSDLKLQRIRQLVDQDLAPDVIRERLGLNASQYHKIVTLLGLARKFPVRSQVRK